MVDESTSRYYSVGGIVWFALFNLLIVGVATYSAWRSAVIGEPHFILPIGLMILLALGVWGVSLTITVSADGAVTFRGLLRRQTWPIQDLVTVRPGQSCFVFKFRRGGAMVASNGERAWVGLFRQIHAANPQVKFIWPELWETPKFPPADSGTG